MTFFQFLAKALSEDNGNPSSMRIATLVASLLFTISIAFGFIFVLFCYKELLLTYLEVVSALLAALLGIKVWQKKNEAEPITPSQP